MGRPGDVGGKTFDWGEVFSEEDRGVGWSGGTSCDEEKGRSGELDGGEDHGGNVADGFGWKGSFEEAFRFQKEVVILSSSEHVFERLKTM